MVLTLFWRPVIQLLTNVAPDADILAVLKLDATLDQQLTSLPVREVTPNRLDFSAPDKVYRLERYQSPGRPVMLRLSTDKGGHMPLLLGIQNVSFATHNGISYQLLVHDRLYTGRIAHD